MPRARSPILNLENISDIYIRENFRLLQDYFDTQNQLLDFELVNISFTAAGTKTFAHGLGQIPQDIIRLSCIGSGTLTFNRSSFTSSIISVTSTGAITAKFLIGITPESNQLTSVPANENHYASVSLDVSTDTDTTSPYLDIPATSIDWSASSVFRGAITTATEYTFTGATDGQTIIVVVTATGACAITWPTEVLWAGGTSPTQTTDGTDVYTFIYIDGVYYGSVVQDMQ